jgi:anti-anti-sigma factor
MLSRTRAVEVHLVPGNATPSRERSFLQDLVNSVKAERPRFVLDCSQIWEMDTDAIHLLLSCLEEVLKCNGDVRLASLQSGAESALRLAGINRLFEIYPTVESAAQSFQRRPVCTAVPAYAASIFETENEHAA